MEKNELDLTRDALKRGFCENRLARGFAIHPDDNKEEDSVLILGLNPAGDEKDADRERIIQSLCYVPGLDQSGVLKRCHYPRYFKPIYDLVQETISKDVMVKWSWCNIPWEELEEQLKNIGVTEEQEEQKGKILDFYQKANAKEEGNLTIYTGDMFYYHETQSGKLKELLVDGFDNSYYLEMLKWHIKTLQEDHHKSIKYVYINNALASHGLTDGGVNAGASMIYIDDVPVFTGCMLSGGRAMDVFSRTRLVSEIKQELGRHKQKTCFFELT